MIERQVKIVETETETETEIGEKNYCPECDEKTDLKVECYSEYKPKNFPSDYSYRLITYSCFKCNYAHHYDQQDYRDDGENDYITNEDN
ncbi:hypothetical protein NBRC116592_20350 [Colwellia sp. KU-HH00111]|uniref:hypothetical protein n=1 Tax=Colwellia sp. KU-HH00111 TaxID=3127652 RepID=UPI003101F673